MTSLPAIQTCVESHSPRLIRHEKRKLAAVSLILTHSDSDVEILFIERAKRLQDPWSGQMAFPGGKWEHGDINGMATAMRETHEEVGLNLHSRDCIGRLDDFGAPKNSPASGLVVEPYIFKVSPKHTPSINSEVSDALWISLGWLTDTANFVPNYNPENYEDLFPGFRVSADDSRVIWGLTYRLVVNFLCLIGVQVE